MNTGNIYRKLRKDKKLTLKEASVHILSISQLSKFECGQNDVSATKLFLLLERVNVTLAEYYSMITDFEECYIDQLINSVNEYIYYKDYESIDYLVLKLEKEYKGSKNKFDYYIYIVIIIKLSNTEYKNSMRYVTEEEISELTDYLFSVEDWTYFEIILYSNSLEKIEWQSMMVFSLELSRKATVSLSYENYQKVVIEIILNTLLRCLKENRLFEAKTIQKCAVRLLAKGYRLREQNILLYCSGLLQYLSGEKESGEKKVLQAIEIFKILKAEKLAMNYFEIFSNLKKK